MKKVLLSLLCLTASATLVSAQSTIAGTRADMAKKTAIAQSVAGASQPPPAATSTADPDAGKFQFKEETHDYGEIPEGPTAEYDFEFKNTGKKPINITEAHGSCGCTVPKWPSEPILPKHKGVIHVTYNTAGRVGPISKDVFITSNAQQSPMKLHITGTVIAKPVPATPPAVPPPPANK